MDDRVTHIVIVLRDGRVATINPNPELELRLDAVLAELTRISSAAAGESPA